MPVREMRADELEIDAALVRRLLRGEFPTSPFRSSVQQIEQVVVRRLRARGPDLR
jgi:hypothetical protein